MEQITSIKRIETTQGTRLELDKDNDIWIYDYENATRMLLVNSEINEIIEFLKTVPIKENK